MNSVKCPQCGLITWATEQSCKRCGLSLAPTYNVPPLFPSSPQQPNFQQPYNPQQPVYQTQPTQPFVNQQTQSGLTQQQTTSNYNNTYSSPQTPPQQDQSHNFQSTYGAPKQNQESYQQNYQADYQANYQQNYPPNYQQQNYNYGYNNQYGQTYPPNYSYPQNNLSLYARQKKGLPTASMIIGIVSLVLCGLLGVGPITGFILGLIGYNKAKKEPQQYGGETMALVGIALNVLAFFVLFLAVARFASTVPSNYSASYQAANESSAISSTRTLLAAEATYQATAGQGQYGSLTRLAEQQLIDSTLASGTKNGYSFVIRVLPNSCEIFVTPVSSNNTARSFYASCGDNVIRSSRNGLPAGASDPPIDGASNPSRRNTSYNNNSSYDDANDEDY